MAGKIAHETDADGNFIKAFRGEVAALNLLEPAPTYFNLPVARIRAVADDKVVSHAVFHATFAVIGIKDGGISAGGAAVVNDDVLPGTQTAAGGIDLRADGRKESELRGGGGKNFWGGGGWGILGGGRGGREQAQNLGRLESVPRKRVPLAKLGEGDSMFARNFGEGIPFFDFDPFLWRGGDLGGEGRGGRGSWGGGELQNVSRVEARGIDGRVGLHKSLGGGAVSLGDLIKSFSFLDGVGRGGGERSHEKNAGRKKDKAARGHLLALAGGGRFADPFCEEGGVGHGLAETPGGGRTDHLRQCSSAR